MGISWDQSGPVQLKYPELDSYLQAELIAKRVNVIQGSCDYERSQIVAAWAAVGGDIYWLGRPRA